MYAVEWSEQGLAFEVDGETYFEIEAEDVDMPTAPMYIIFDQAVMPFAPALGPAAYGAMGGMCSSSSASEEAGATGRPWRWSQ